MPQFVALRVSFGSSTASGGRHRDWPQALHRRAIRPLKDRPDRPQKMGPTSLPTPLSPMRGLARRQGLGIRCLPVRAVRRQALPVLSPALAPASGSVRRPTRSSAPDPKTLASVPGRPAMGGTEIALSIMVVRFHLHQGSSPKTFSSDASSADDRLARSIKEVFCAPSSTHLRQTEVFSTSVSGNTWTASSMSSRFGYSP